MVFPEPVPPEINKLYFAITSFSRKSAASFVMAPFDNRSSIVMRFVGKRRIVSIGPFRATGFNTTLTLDPSGSLASTMGLDSLTTLLQKPTICWMTLSSLSGAVNERFHFIIRPAFSIKMLSGPFTIISVTSGFSTSSCRMSKARS